jgi:hypothetical protein
VKISQTITIKIIKHDFLIILTKNIPNPSQDTLLMTILYLDSSRRSTAGAILVNTLSFFTVYKNIVWPNNQLIHKSATLRHSIMLLVMFHIFVVTVNRFPR